MASENSIDLTRSTVRWQQAANAGGFVLRYADVIHRWLNEKISDERVAREILAHVVNRLAQKGYGETNEERFRNYLLQITARIADAYFRKVHPERQFSWTVSAPSDTAWNAAWADNLLARSWRALERLEHTNAKSPLYTILMTQQLKPADSNESLASQLSTEHGIKLKASDLPRALGIANRRFAQLLAGETAETLRNPKNEDIVGELRQLNLQGLVEPFC